MAEGALVNGLLGGVPSWAPWNHLDTPMGRMSAMDGRVDAEREIAHPAWLPSPALLERTTTVVIAGALITGVAAEPDPPSWGYLAFAVGAVGAFMARRRWLVGLVLVAVAPLLAVRLGSEPVALWSIATFVAFLLALRGRPAVLTASVVAVANFTAQWLTINTFDLQSLVTPGIAALTALVAAAVGSAVRANWQYWSALQARAHDAVTGRELVVRQSIAEERLRIARDLHDSVGHAVAVVSMRLGAAEVQLPAEAEGARAELADARTGVQDILREMQQILQVLRVGDEGQVLTPTPEGSLVPALVADFRSAGLTVVADLSDTARPLPAHIGSATYRIVQEALTNAHKHGAGAVHLRVAVDGDVVRIDVENHVAQAPVTSSPAAADRPLSRPAGGQGLVGMRERAAATGGRLIAGSQGPVFAVRAELPIDGGGAR